MQYLCRLCLRGKGGRTPMKVNEKVPVIENNNIIKKDDMESGSCASTDQFERRKTGKIPHTRGKESPEKIFCGGTIFVDHALSKIGISHQVYLDL